MKITANLNHLRMSPRKVRLVADFIRGMDVKEAETQLRFLTKKAAGPVLKLLNSAIANASHDFDIEKDNLYISEIQINEGPTLKRWRARAMGRAAPIMKRTSHINLVLETKKGVKAKKKKAEKTEVVKLGDAEKIKKGLPSEKVEEKEKQIPKSKPTPPTKPYSTTSKSKKKFWARQTFGNVKKMFRRKSF
jgi:large subunit ribosomal protein L22